MCVADCRRRMAGALLILSKKKSGFAELLFNKRCVLKKSFSLNLWFCEFYESFCLLSLLVSGIVELSGLWMEKEMQDCVQWEDIDLRSDELTICRIGLLASGVNPNGLWMEKEKSDLGVVRRKWPWDMNWQSADWSSRRSWWRSQGDGTWSYSKARSHLNCQFQNTFLDPPMLAPPRHPHFWTSFKSKMQRVLSVCEYLANLLLGFVIMLEHLLRLIG